METETVAPEPGGDATSPNASPKRTRIASYQVRIHLYAHSGGISSDPLTIADLEVEIREDLELTFGKGSVSVSAERLDI